MRSSVIAKITKRPSWAARTLVPSSVMARITERPSLAALFNKMGVVEVLRVSKLTDYATVVMTVLAGVRDSGGADDVLSAQDLAARARLELPTVSKLLKQLAHAQLVSSARGVNGGYRLARPPQQITIADIVTAMEGPIGMTECGAHAGLCDHEPHCGVRVNWQRINQAIAQALAEVTVADMVKPVPKRPIAIAILHDREDQKAAIHGRTSQ